MTHLARHDTSALTGLLDPSTVALLSKQGADVTSPSGLAYFIVSVYGEREALRRTDIRALLLLKMELPEAMALCQLCQLPTIAPLQTLKGINFDAADHFDLLCRWYGVENDEPEEPHQQFEGSQKAVASHKLHTHQLNAFRGLRRAISQPQASVLVHMPFGAGKLRVVATAVLDLFRSEEEDRSVIWLAPGNCHV